MSKKRVQIASEVETFFRDIARKHSKSGARRNRMIAFTYEFDANAFERCFARLLKMPVHIDIVASHKSMRSSTYRYNLWHANWQGTFHPKLICLMSGREVMAGLGSSNLTSGGLQENLESWSFSREEAFLSGVRDFLQSIVDQQIISPHVHIEEFLAVLPRSTRKAVFSTLEGNLNLMEQVLARLPSPVKRLDIISPVHGDPAPVIKQFKSVINGEICLYTDNEMIPQIKGINKYKRLERPDALHDEERRSIGRVHAKLYGFHVGKGVHIFWGSPNLSESAWLRSEKNANIELLAHSYVDKKDWQSFIKSPFPGHKWVEMKPLGEKLTTEQTSTLKWRLLNGVRENKKIHLIASNDKTVNLQLRLPGMKTFKNYHLRFLNREATLPPQALKELGFTAPTCPDSLEWRQKGDSKWRSIPINDTDIAPDGTLLSTIVDRLYWEFAGKSLSRRSAMSKSGNNHAINDNLLAEEEELTISEHQGEFDRFVLEWHAIVKRMRQAAQGNNELLIQYIQRVKQEVKTAAEEPDKWPKYKIMFINKLLEEKWES